MTRHAHRPDDAGPNDPIHGPSILVESVLEILEGANVPTVVCDAVVKRIEAIEQIQPAAEFVAALTGPADGMQRLSWLEALLADVEEHGLADHPDPAAVREASRECRDMVQMLRAALAKAGITGQAPESAETPSQDNDEMPL
jgi:hypothetical protein